MRRLASLTLATILLVSLALSSSAQMIADPSSQAEAGVIEAGGAACISTVEYEDGEIERKVVGAYGAYGVNDLFDVYGTLGFILDAEPEDWGDSDTGFLVAAGVRGYLLSFEEIDIRGYAQLQHIKEEYGSASASVPGASGSVSGEGEITELILGAVAEYGFTDALTAYGGVELIPYSDGEIEVSGSAEIDLGLGFGGIETGSSDSGDIERDSLIGVRGGVTYDLGGFWLRGEVAVLSETTFLIGGGTTF